MRRDSRRLAISNLLRGCSKGIFLLAGFIAFVFSARSASLLLTPAADATLIEIAPSNNNGGLLWFSSGTTQNGPRNRGLLRFDLGAVPANSTITSAKVILVVTGQPTDGQANSAFGLYRMLRPWGEGNKTSIETPTPGQGLPADPGELTWLFSFYPTNAWSVPGGDFGVDFSTVESSFQFVYGKGQSPYLFDSTPELVADVQSWVDNPQSNFGWMLLCDDEGERFTARRFASREDTNNAPVLEIEYIPPPRIDFVEKTANEFRLHFTAEAGKAYWVEYVAGFSTSNTWSTLTNVPAQGVATDLIVADPITNAGRFYRLRTQ